LWERAIRQTAVSTGSRSISQGVETFDLRDLYIPAVEVDHGDQLVNKGNLESGVTALHDETILRGPEGDGYDTASTGPNLETYEIVGPVLPLGELTALDDEYLGSPNLLGALTVVDVGEGHLRTLLALAESPHGERPVFDVDDRSGLEVDHLRRLDVDTEKPIQAVGPA
jgi:hypothetical protein